MRTRRPAVATTIALAALVGAAAPAAGAAPVRYATRPALHPPQITINERTGPTAPGLIVLGPKKLLGAKMGPAEQQGPELVDDRGRVRWFRPMPPGEIASDVRVQRYRGRPVITWWQGKLLLGYGFGAAVVADSHYHVIRVFRGAGGLQPDLHEFRLTSHGTALYAAYKEVSADTTSVGGTPEDRVLDSFVQEVDLKTGRVVFQWDALRHVPPSESNVPINQRPAGPWDYFHINSVSPTPDGNLLVSARHTSTIYKIDRRTGAILWRLGGKSSDFEAGPGATFSWQHDAREPSPNVIELFDNDAASVPVRPYSSAMRIRIDPAAHTATLERELIHPLKLSGATQGSTQDLPDGHTFVGWGAQGAFTEFAGDGSVVLDGDLPPSYDSYRAYRSRWTGLPRDRPRLVARRAGRRVHVDVSWNGATEVARWRVLAGRRPGALRPVGGGAWNGLETALTVRHAGRWVSVEALTARGRVLARARAVRLR